MEQSFIDEQESGGGFDIKNYFSKLGKNFYWFIIALLIFGTGAFMYLKYTQPLFKLSTYVLIKKPTEAKNLIGGTPFANGSSDNASGAVDINSEIFKLKSGQILGEAIDSLNFQVSVTSNETVKHQPVSLDSVPFVITSKMADPNVDGDVYTVAFGADSWKATSEFANVTGKYDQPVKLGKDTVTITRKQGFKAGSEYDLQLIGRDNVIAKYLERIEVGPVPQGGPDMLQVSVTDEFPERAMKLIGVLVYRYDLANLDYKNKALRVEMAFLQKQLNDVTEELNQQESIVSNFKSTNQVNDVSASATELLGDMKVIDRQKSENDLKQNMLGILEQNVKSGATRDEVISTTGLQDPVLTDMIAKYNTAIIAKKDILDKGTSLDPRLESINQTLSD
ncbi:MAG: hypothetical protein EOP49_26360, partial [Sphingobacteriales bacterium]